MEAQSFGTKVGQFNIKKANFLVVNNDWGLGASKEFQKMLKARALPSAWWKPWMPRPRI